MVVEITMVYTANDHLIASRAVHMMLKNNVIQQSRLIRSTDMDLSTDIYTITNAMAALL